MAEVWGHGRGLYVYRALVVVLLLGAVWLSIAATIAGVTRRYQPDIALRLQPFDALANAEQASNLQLNPRARADRGQLMAMAQRALRRDPTMAKAARVIGLIQAERNRLPAAQQALLYSDRLTHRDLATQLWLIEYYVQQNDVPAVLRHFDAAASSSSGATTILFPILVNALNHDDLVAPMAEMLGRRPWWSPSLLMAMAQGTENLGNVENLFVRLSRAGARPRADIVAVLAGRLAASGETARAERLPRALDAAEQASQPPRR